MLRPLISWDLLVSAVRAGTHRVVIASVHPADANRIPIDLLRAGLGGAPVVTSPAVTRGELFVDSVPTRV